MSLDNGIVLPGITRESIIEMLEDHAAGRKELPLEGMPKQVRVVERDITMREVVEGIEDGTLKG
jgi:branched-chain amino acid aminotransferase